jgi:ubiquinol-cytochrome c reductase cytochrome b subunit
MQSGPEYGNLTLTRFYALHVFLLPGALTALLAIHLLLFRKHGVTTSWRLSQEDAARRTELFWPAQILKDTVWMMLILAVLLALAVLVGAPLDAPADPSTNYDARPEWYFLFLFQLLKYFEGPMAIIGTIVIPTLAASFLIALPFLDRGESRAPKHRKAWFFAFFTLIGATVVLTVVALVEDRGNAEFREALAEQEEQARLAKHYAAIGGIDPSGQVILYRGHTIFEEQRCTNCHAVAGREQPEKKQGFVLTGYLSREWYRSFIRDPNGPRFCGGLKCEGVMPPHDMPDDQLDAVVELVASQTGIDYEPPIDPELAEKGLAVFEGDDCTSCHTLDGTALVGPTLKGIGSVGYLRSFLRDPGAPTHFGDLNAMPAYPDLPPAEMDLLIDYLRFLHTLPMTDDVPPLAAAGAAETGGKVE